MTVKISVDKFICACCQNPFFVVDDSTIDTCPHCKADIEDYSDEDQVYVIEEDRQDYIMDVDPFTGLPTIQTYTDYWDEDIELTTKPILQRRRYSKSDISKHTFLMHSSPYRSYAIFAPGIQEIMGYTQAPQDVWAEEPDALLIPITKEEFDNATNQQ